MWWAPGGDGCSLEENIENGGVPSPDWLVLRTPLPRVLALTIRKDSGAHFLRQVEVARIVATQHSTQQCLYFCVPGLHELGQHGQGQVMAHMQQELGEGEVSMIHQPQEGQFLG